MIDLTLEASFNPRGYSKNFYTGRLRHEVQPLTLLYTTEFTKKVLAPFVHLLSQHENGDLRKIKVCVNLRKVGHPTLRKLSTARKGL